MPYATVEDMEAALGYTIDDTGNTRPTESRLERLLFRADDIIHAEMHVEDNILVERTKITCDYSALSGGECIHFFVTNSNAGETEYYIWFNTGSDSDPNESGTAIEVDISSITTDRGLATAAASAINSTTDLAARAWGHGVYLYIENYEMFNASDTEDGTASTGFTIETLQDGSDDSGALKNIAIELVSFMINNMFSFSNPDKYALKNVELTKDHIRTIHKTYYKWSADSFELDGR